MLDENIEENMYEKAGKNCKSRKKIKGEDVTALLENINSSYLKRRFDKNWGEWTVENKINHCYNDHSIFFYVFFTDQSPPFDMKSYEIDLARPSWLFPMSKIE